VYILAAPLIPFVRLWRTVPLLDKVDAGRGVLLRLLPALVACLVLDSIGETAGYALGAGHAMVRKVETFERLRFRHLSRADRRAYDAGGLGRPERADSR
jgi:hypothetical protein